MAFEPQQTFTIVSLAVNGLTKVPLTEYRVYFAIERLTSKSFRHRVAIRVVLNLRLVSVTFT